MNRKRRVALHNQLRHASATTVVEIASEQTKEGKLCKNAVIRAEHRLGNATRFVHNRDHLRELAEMGVVEDDYVWGITRVKSDATHSEMVNGYKAQVTQQSSSYSSGKRIDELLDNQKVVKGNALEVLNILRKQLRSTTAVRWDENLEEDRLGGVVPGRPVAQVFLFATDQGLSFVSARI